ncbi:MAG: fasciclin domain-containing protein [Cyanobacteriota bacterium]|nr:fasciclin domain-containing protein [Cyanobacteriota bacterium]
MNNRLINSAIAPQLAVLTGILGLAIVSSPARAQMQDPQTPVVQQVPPATPGNIVEVAQGNPNFSTLVQAVQAAELDDALSGDGPFTVFAPTNDAFNALPDEALEFLLKPENRDLLADVLKYHVVPDRVPSSDLEDGALDTLNGGVAVDVTPDRVIINDASVIAPDVPAENGVIHGINRVLIPPAVRDRLAQQMPVRGLW